MPNSRQFVVVAQEDLPVDHPIRKEWGSPSGPLVFEQYLGDQASLEAIARRANLLAAQGYPGIEVWRVIRPRELRSMGRLAFFLGLGVGVFVPLAILIGFPSL